MSNIGQQEEEERMQEVRSDDRIEALEARVGEMDARLEALEARATRQAARHAIRATTPPVAPPATRPTRSPVARPATRPATPPVAPRATRSTTPPPAAVAAPPPAPRPAGAASRSTAPGPARTPAWRADLEDLLGGRILGLVGGLAVLLGIAFFVAVAIGRGWIDEPTRMALALTASFGLTVGGALLYERRGRTQAALAMAASGIAGMFLTLTAATQLYDLVPAPLALVGALAAGAAGTGLAVRWNARTVGALGILGALLAPVLVGAGAGEGSLAFLGVALLAAVGVLLWRRWDWLALAAFAVTAPQVVAWAAGDPSTLGLLVAPFVFWALHVAAAFGYELRVRAPRPRRSSVGLVLAAGAVAAGVGWWGLESAGHRALADGLLAVLASAHLVLGLAALRTRGVARGFGFVLVAGAIALGDIAFGLVLSGPVQAAGWAASAVLMAALARVAREDRDLLRLGLGAQLGLAAVHAVAVDARPDHLLSAGGDVPGAVAALGLVALAAFACARLSGERPEVRAVLDLVAMGAVAYLTAFALEGTALVVAWAAQAVAIGQVARREGDRVAAEGSLGFLGLAATYVLAAVVPPEMAIEAPAAPAEALPALVALGAAAFVRARQAAPGSAAAVTCDALAATTLGYATAVALEGPVLAIAWAAEAAALLTVASGRSPAPATLRPRPELAPADVSPAELAGVAALVLGVLAALHALVFEAPVSALVIGVDDLRGAVGALVAVGVLGFAAGRLAPAAAWRTAGAVAGASALLYLGSVAIVSAFQPDAASLHTGLAGLEVRQEGQVLLSAFWGMVGLAALLGGLLARRRPARVAGLGLLVLAIAKVFAFDLASLDSMYRVLSLVGLGLVLLAGAFAWQRLRPPGPVTPAP
ncbi:MAG TPA: DUF2339 domain-containing protein [Solirubrobacteraceae bacterium]|nr:DUF2339 domain-containing protein [Solirubrobacteraceae bacterium]